jgi:PKD repeat protein
VKFTNQSSGTITSYSWNFGDGGSSPQASPTYTFPLPGLYNVTLSVVGPGGTSNVSRQINVQSPTTPVAGFTQDKTSGPSPLTVQFTNQSTGNISSYSWIFGDGETSSEQNPSHQFVDVGTYNVIFTVTGPGGTSSVTRKITVEDPVIPPPEAKFTPDKTSGDLPLQVQFANQSTGQITNFVWDFGDNQTSTDTNPTHIFADAGSYTVTLTAIGQGGQKTAQTLITVIKPATAPTAAFTQDKTSGDAPLVVQFTNQSQGDITSFQWAFGDGETSADQSPSHIFKAPGNYTVRLTITGPGGSNSTEISINATQPIAVPDAAFTQDLNVGTAPMIVQFTNQSTGQNLTYTWDFGDNSGMSSEINPQHSFANAGNYVVTLTVSNSNGTDTAQGNITVNAPQPIKPVANFTPSMTSGDAPLTITFDSSASSGDITGYNWSFGDSVGTSIEPNPTYVFANAGTYVVTLTVSGPGGDSDPTSASITVNNVVAPPSIPAPASFISNRDGNNEVYVIGIDGSLTNLTNNPADDHSPIWSSDGSRIAFVSNRDNGNNDIFIMNADGSNLINISNNPANDESPTWSSDGSQVAFVSDRDGNREVYIVNLPDTSNPTNLTNNPANDNSPDWSANGTQIAFVSDRDNANNDIFLINSDGSNPVNLTNNPANDNSPRIKP